LVLRAVFLGRKFFLYGFLPLVAMRFLGFVFHEMAFGLLSVFLPLYIVNTLHGTLTDVGVMIAVAYFVAVPFSFLWGYLCDRMRRYRLFILMSFLGMSALFYVFSLTTSILLLIVLYGLIAVFHSAHEAPKNVLIAEDYTRADWEQNFASYEAQTDVGWITGLVLGFVFSLVGLASVWFILFVSFLNLVGFVFSIFLIHDPVFIFERKLVAAERFFDFAHRGFAVASRALAGARVTESLKSESLTIFCMGLFSFFFATNMLFTPLPVFFNSVHYLNLTESVVFIVFIFNTLGGTVGYVLAGRRAEISDERGVIGRAALSRTLLSLLLVLVAIWGSVLLGLAHAFMAGLAVLILVLMGLVYGLFWISSLSLSMELIPEGKAGLFNALVGLGGAFGCFLGTLFAQSYGFSMLFVIVAIVFALSYVAFKTYV
jgi:MFS family permease